MTTLALGSLGGFVSFLSTSLGALGSAASQRSKTFSRWNVSLDFALGLMVSAASVSLIGPAALAGLETGSSLLPVALAMTAGLVGVFLLHRFLGRIERVSQSGGSRALLMLVLMLHNFPEGIASGAALAGLNPQEAFPILGGIAIQNIPEGALMVISLNVLGWTRRNALLGGLASGVVEQVGGIFAGFLLIMISGILPILLAFTGGAMLAAVTLELGDNRHSIVQRVISKDFALGLIAPVALQFIMV